jgi:hypothetical protein
LKEPELNMLEENEDQTGEGGEEGEKPKVNPN